MHATASVDSVEASDRHTYRSGTAVHVVATTLRATRAALGAATTLAKGLESRVHVIAAGQTPSEWSLDQQLALVHTFARSRSWTCLRPSRPASMFCRVSAGGRPMSFSFSPLTRSS
jgi:hypothetical protein